MPQYRRQDVSFPRIRSVHGTADRIIPLGPTQEVFASLEESGFEVELVPFEGVEHTMSAEMNTQLHEWLEEALTGVVRQGVADGLLDGGLPPCPDAGVGLDGSWPDGGVPEAGLDGGLDAGSPCRPVRFDAARPDASVLDADTMDAAAAEPFLRELDY